MRNQNGDAFRVGRLYKRETIRLKKLIRGWAGLDGVGEQMRCAEQLLKEAKATQEPRDDR